MALIAKFLGLELLSKVGAPGGVMTPEYDLSLLTMHGTLMVFFVLTNAPVLGRIGNYLLPIQIGARTWHFPRSSYMMSFWTTFIAFIVLITVVLYSCMVFAHSAGWTSYAPL